MPVFDLGTGAYDAAVSSGNDMAVALGSTVGSFFPLFMVIFAIGWIVGTFGEIRNGMIMLGR